MPKITNLWNYLCSNHTGKAYDTHTDVDVNEYVYGFGYWSEQSNDETPTMELNCRRVVFFSRFRESRIGAIKTTVENIIST